MFLQSYPGEWSCLALFRLNLISIYVKDLTVLGNASPGVLNLRIHRHPTTMKLLQDCWIALLELFNVLTLSSPSGRSALQQPLEKSRFHLFNNEEHRPIFSPPSHPENPDSTIKCDYTALGNEWEPCSTPTNRSCWLKGPKGEVFDIHTNYEIKYPKGIKRKASGRGVFSLKNKTILIMIADCRKTENLVFP